MSGISLFIHFCVWPNKHLCWCLLSQASNTTSQIVILVIVFFFSLIDCENQHHSSNAVSFFSRGIQCCRTMETTQQNTTSLRASVQKEFVPGKCTLYTAKRQTPTSKESGLHCNLISLILSYLINKYFICVDSVHFSDRLVRYKVTNLVKKMIQNIIVQEQIVFSQF